MIVVNTTPNQADPDNADILLDAPLLLVPETETGDDPTVGDGAGALTPFILVAVDESAAKPTDAGEARKTEYTFLRKVSPIMNGGAVVPAGLFSAKKEPTHVS